MGSPGQLAGPQWCQKFSVLWLEGQNKIITALSNNEHLQGFVHIISLVFKFFSQGLKEEKFICNQNFEMYSFKVDIFKEAGDREELPANPIVTQRVSRKGFDQTTNVRKV